MKLIRAVEEGIAERYQEQKMRCPTHLSTGQEAVSAAVGLALRVDDYAVSTHRAHGHYLGKGGDLQRMIAEIYGKACGCSRGRGGSMHLIDQSVGFMGSTPIVGNSIPIGAGLGLSIRLDGTDQISCVFLGEGATEEGVFSETVNFCAQRNLPVLFVCENNLYSVYSPLKVRQPANRSIATMVEAMGVRSQSGDGNNAIEVYEITLEAISAIRAGAGPRFLEFETFRWREHCGPNFDNDIGYRTEEEFLRWKKRDPILLVETQMLKGALLTSKEISDIDELIDERVSAAFDFADDSPFPERQEAYDHVYAKDR